MHTQNTVTRDNILVVVDPTREEHPALDRALITSRLRDPRPHIHLFVGVDLEVIDNGAPSAGLCRPLEGLTALLEPLRTEGLDSSAEISWAPRWQDAVLDSARRFDADMLVVTDYAAALPARDTGKGRWRTLTDAKWALLRNAECPVLIVRPGGEARRKAVLAAVNMQTDDPRYDVLNDKIVSRGHWMASRYGADFHIVNAYADSLHYPDRGRMLRKVDLPPEQVHVRQGSPEDVIAETAREIEADVVVIGTLARKGVLAAMRGNTSEKVLNKLTCDVMTLN